MAGEAKRPQHTKQIFGKTLGRVPNGAEDLFVQVSGTAPRIQQLVALRMPGKCIKSEITPGEILFDIFRELHDGASAEGLDVTPEGRDLVECSVGSQDADRSMIHANGHGSPESGHDLLRARLRREVPVAHGPTQ